MADPHISVFSEHAATVSGRYVRYRKDGSVIAEFGGTYSFAKMSDGWRIVSIMWHDPTKVFELSK